MNDERSRSGQVEVGIGRQVCVGHECTTGDIFSGVQHQSNSEAGANERMG